jgi:hypothetical protein
MIEKQRERIILKELETVKKEFHQLLDSLSNEDLKRVSKNTDWTNGEILFHMVFAFMLLSSLIPLVKLFGKLPQKYSKVFSQLLNSSTKPFNWINSFGARGGGRFHSREMLEKRFDSTIGKLIKRLNNTKEKELDLGMYYPVKWDSLFDEYMTLEKLFYYPVKHFQFHKKQISNN